MHALPLARLSALLLLLAGGLFGCGEPVVGGSGRIVAHEGAVGPRHVVVEGTPYELGYWQGRVLRAEIQALHPRWQARAFGAGERGRTLRAACEIYVDQTLRLLPEAARQELEGLSAGSGVPARDLLLSEVLLDGLRFHGERPPIPGDLAIRTGGGDGGAVEAWFASESPAARLLGEVGVLLERRPVEGCATLLATWPGSLGGLGGASARRLGAVAVGVPAETEGQSLSGVPFTLRLRHALERAADPEEVLERLAGGTAHRVAVLGTRPRKALLGVAASAGRREADLTTLPFVVVEADVPVGEVVLPAAPSDPAAALGAFLGGDDTLLGVTLDGEEIQVHLGGGRSGRPLGHGFLQDR